MLIITLPSGWADTWRLLEHLHEGTEQSIHAHLVWALWCQGPVKGDWKVSDSAQHMNYRLSASCLVLCLLRGWSRCSFPFLHGSGFQHSCTHDPFPQILKHTQPPDISSLSHTFLIHILPITTPKDTQLFPLNTPTEPYAFIPYIHILNCTSQKCIFCASGQYTPAPPTEWKQRKTQNSKLYKLFSQGVFF